MKSFKRTIALWTAAVLAAGSLPVGGTDTVCATEAAELQNEAAATADHLIINQVYGGGGKSDTPITNSFIELYNPTSDPISLDDYHIAYESVDTKTNLITVSGADLPEGKTVSANSSYLIICNEETTSDDLLSYDLPEADQTWDFVISNKNYSIQLMKNETEIDKAKADQNVPELKISKQFSLRRVSYVDTDSNTDWNLIGWKKADIDVNEDYVNQYAPRNSKGEMGKVHTASESGDPTKPENPTEPSYTPVVTGNTKVTGYQNGKSTLDMQLVARHNSGACNADGGSLEIVEYNSANGYAYAVSGLKGKIIAVKADNIPASDTVVDLEGTEYDVKDLVASNNGFTYGDITSVAVSPDGKKLAAAVQHADMAENGVVAIFDCEADGSLKNPAYVKVGVQPDMVVFADTNTILTADEGEPRDGYGDGCTDPKGTVSVVDVEKLQSLQAGFEAYSAEQLTAQNIIVGCVSGNTIAPEFDLEPEYIAVTADGKQAFVSLQEANAVAVLDVAQKKFTGIYSVGYEDYSQVAVDLVEDKKYEAKTYEKLVGARMPDGIALYENGGKTYLLTANEGDAREWGDYINEAKTTEFTGKKIRILDPEKCAGLPDGKSVMFGGRGFSVFEVTEDGLQEVYDSANEFEKITGEVLPQYFNCSNDDNEADSRSPKKGPEPENVTVGTVGDRTYAFVAVERIGGIMVYDITDPAKSTYVNYINSREFENAIQGDVSPEGLCFVESGNAGKPMLFAACEVSGTLAAYELTAKQETEEKPSDGKEEEKPQTPGQGQNGSQTSGQGTEQSQEQNKEEVKEEPKADSKAPSVGTEITDPTTKVTYRVTKSDQKEKAVAFVAATENKKTTVKIPATVTLDGVTYQVTAIADNAFKNNKTVTKVTIPKSVTTIGKNAFSGCTKLRTISIGSKVTTIGANAFKGCKSLTKITLSDKTTKIGANAFYGCKNLKTITIKSKKLSLKSVSKNAFKGISGKTTIKVPKGKAKAYKTLLRKRGLSKKVTVK